MPVQFNREQHEALNTARPTSPALQQRVEALRLLEQGLQVEVVARRLEVRQKSVYEWHRQFRLYGIPKLTGGVPSTPLSAVDDDYRRRLEQALAVPMRRLSIDELRLILSQQTGKLLSASSFRRLLIAMGYVYGHVERWEQGALVFAGSTWVKAAAKPETSDAERVDDAGSDGSVAVTERGAQMPLPGLG
jgi:transposase